MRVWILLDFESETVWSLSVTEDLIKGTQNKFLANSVVGDDHRMLFPL